MSKEIDTEKWLATLFSELIRRGMEHQEHVHFKDFPLNDSPAPNLEQLKNAHIGWAGEFLTPLLKDHFDQIISDYQKQEEPKVPSNICPGCGYSDGRENREDGSWICWRCSDEGEWDS
jgi:hypothetical protein